MTAVSRTDWPAGVWSAAPTPLTEDYRVDTVAVKRMVEHHLRLGVSGLFLRGTNGEGNWLPDRERRAIVRSVVKAAAGRLPVAVQVSDNSWPRIVDNMNQAQDDGADIAVIAPPLAMNRETPALLADLYLQAIRRSPLPVGIYDRGKHSSVLVPPAVLKQLYAEPKVVMIKDSSMDPAHQRVALAARKLRPSLRLLSGYEFDCVSYLRAGYDGLLLGGGVFNGYLARLIMQAVAAGDFAGAEELQARMNRLMYDVYGGPKITCWLAGEKQLLVEMGLLRTHRNYLGYELTPACAKAITKALAREREYLFPAPAEGKR
jgi:4-hydroxy-tetrahydrodipicolinate synthase